jgi:hypothetical protein
MTEPTMSAATIHSRTAIMVMAETAPFIGRIRSSTAPARSTVR